jgi:hypothetical protein
MLTLAEHPDIQDAVNVARLEWPRAGEAWEATRWTLARDPWIGRRLTHGEAWVLVCEGSRSNGFPTVVVQYEIHDSIVVIEGVTFGTP